MKVNKLTKISNFTFEIYRHNSRLKVPTVRQIRQIPPSPQKIRTRICLLAHYNLMILPNSNHFFPKVQQEIDDQVWFCYFGSRNGKNDKIDYAFTQHGKQHQHPFKAEAGTASSDREKNVSSHFTAGLAENLRGRCRGRKVAGRG